MLLGVFIVAAAGGTQKALRSGPECAVQLAALQQEVLEIKENQLSMKRDMGRLLELLQADIKPQPPRINRRLQTYEEEPNEYSPSREEEPNEYSVRETHEEPQSQSLLAIPKDEETTEDRGLEALVVALYIIISITVFAIAYHWLDNSGITEVVRVNGKLEIVVIVHFTHPHDNTILDEHVYSWWDAFFFSMVVQSTVGFGSFVPLSRYSRFIVALQILSTFGLVILQTDMFV